MEWHRRRRPRVPLHYPVQLHSDDNLGAGILLNLSPTGCQVRTTLKLEPGSYLAVGISVPQHGQPLAVELSIVRWHENGRYGLEFLRYGQGERDRLVDLTKSAPYLGSHDDVQDELVSFSPSHEPAPVLATIGE